MTTTWRNNRVITLLSLAAALFLLSRAAQSAELTIDYYPSNEQGFFRAPVLIQSDHEALLIDGGFTFSDAQALIHAIKATGKHLTTIYISQSDPDYYFNLKPIVEAFPEAQVLASSDTVAAINASVEHKLAVWGPVLQENGPQSVAEIVVPKAYDNPTLTFNGEAIEIVKASTGLSNRRYLWIPSKRAIVGGVMVFEGAHVWLADTPTLAQQQAWVATLNSMLAKQPLLVVPGHMPPGSATDSGAITFTRDYLIQFIEAAAGSNSQEVIDDMKHRYPKLPGESILEMSAKVVKGEMEWN